jgi:hypothetical protein
MCEGDGGRTRPPQTRRMRGLHIDRYSGPLASAAIE